MKKIKIIISALVIMCFFTVGAGETAFAEDSLIVDYSEIIADPSCQFYYSDEDEFYIDGIRVFCNGKEVTGESKIEFNTTPASTFDGQNHDYIVPFTVRYNGLSCDGKMAAKIGVRGDANCDNKLTMNDAVLIENQLVQYHGADKSTLDSFGIFLANADGRQTQKNLGVYGKNDLNIGDAFFISSYLNGGKKGMLYDNILLKNAAKPESGEITVSSAQGMGGNTVQIEVAEKCQKALGAFDFTLSWTDKNLELVSVASTRTSLNVDYALKGNSVRIWGYGKSGLVNDGRIVALKFQIPQGAKNGESYGISVSAVNYFGAGRDISDYVNSADGKINVTDTPSLIRSETGYVSEIPSYDYSVKAWDTAVNYGTESVELPVMLLGGAKPTSFDMTVSCSSPISIEGLDNAITASQNSDGSITGYYENKDGLKLDFETLKIKIAKDAAPGKYPVKIKISSMTAPGVEGKCTVIDGSVTVREKSYVLGDANLDGNFNVRDAAYIAGALSKGQGSTLVYLADYNRDNIINIRDAAAIAKKLAG